MRRHTPILLLLLSCAESGDVDATDDPDGTSDDTGPDPSCWQAATLLEVSAAAGAGDGYAAPTLAGGCEDDTFRVTSNGIPHYTFVQTTPNALVEQELVYTIPREPALASVPTDIPLLGFAGFAVNGMPFFGPNEAGQPADQAWGDPVYNGIMDGCLGHTAAQYHFHALSQRCLTPESLVEAPWTLAAPDGSQASPVLGWAADGFPIHGPFDCTDASCDTVVEMKSSWDRIGDPTTDAWDAHEFVARDDADRLDRCNGHVGPEGDYHYHATADFPYILGCFSGTPTGTGGGDGNGTNDTPQGGDGGDGPTACETPADCVDACPQDALGCTCHEVMPGDARCIPTCETAADCPPGPGGMTLTCDPVDEVCVPGGAP